MLTYFTAPSDRAGEDRYTVGAVRARLLRLPTRDLDLATRALTRELEAFNHLVAPDSRYLPVLELFHSHTEGLLPHLQARLDGISPPITHVMRQHARAVDDLLRQLATAYRNTLLSSHGLLSTLLHKRELHLPLVRAIDLLSRRLMLAYRLYARPPTGVWRSLHELYLLARRRNIAMLDLNAAHTSPEALYRKTVLLAFAEPARLSVHELRRTRDYIARFGDVGRFHDGRTKARSSQGLFLIDLDADEPGVPLSRHRERFRPKNSLLLSTRSLLERLTLQYERLSFGTTPTQLGLPVDLDPRRYRAFIRRLALAWRAVPRKRRSRLRFPPRAELYAGFPAAWAQMQSDQVRPASGDKPRNAAPNEWAILNESPEGYALRYLSGPVGAARVGDIVVLRSRHQGHLHPCLVRWVRSEPGENLAIGLEQMRGRFEPATFRRLQAPQYGQVPILIAPVPRERTRFTVLTAARLLGTRQVILVRRGARETKFLARAILESTTFVDVVRLEALE